MSNENGKVEELKEDVNDVKETIKNEPHNVKRTLRYRLKKNLHFILLGSVVAVFALFYIFGNVEIPEAMIIAFTIIGITMVLMYPYAVRVADWFIEDNRKPLLDIENVEDDLAVYKAPEERISLMEVTDGKTKNWNTALGVGKEVRSFQEHITDDGKSHLEAQGTWEGSKSPLELKKDYNEIDALREDLEPWARKGFMYESKLPQIVHRIQAETGNDLIYQFQDLVNFNGAEIHESVQDIINDSKVEDESSNNDETDEDLEKLAQMINGNMEDMMNGDSNGE